MMRVKDVGKTKKTKQKTNKNKAKQNKNETKQNETKALLHYAHVYYCQVKQKPENLLVQQKQKARRF